MRLWCEMGFAQVLILEDRMNEIISRIAAAAGISEETALEAVTIILNFLKKVDEFIVRKGIEHLGLLAFREAFESPLKISDRQIISPL